MQLEHSFTVAAPVEQAWALLLDVERIAPCMPGATLTSFTADDFEGNVRVKLGPVSLTYAGKGRFVERDEQAHRMVMEASGRDNRGGGTAKATVTGTLAPAPDGPGTLVTVVTDLAITGRPAQFGRGMITDVGGRLIGQFANCLASKLAEMPAAPAAPAPPPAAAEAEASDAAPAEAGAATAEAGAAAARVAADPPPAPEPAPSTPAAPPPPAAPPTPAEPIDLLKVTGVSAAVKRALPYVIGFVVAGLLTWALLSWLA